MVKVGDLNNQVKRGGVVDCWLVDEIVVIPSGFKPSPALFPLFPFTASIRKL